jgi:alpha-galactosidase
MAPQSSVSHCVEPLKADAPVKVDLQLRIEEQGQWIDPARNPQWRISGPAASSAHVQRITLARADGRAAGLVKLQLAIALPLLNYGGVLVPDCGRHYINTPKALDIRQPLAPITAANAGHPFFAVNDEAGNLLVAAGLLNHAGLTTTRRLLPVISQRRSMVGGDQLLQLAFEWTADHQSTSPLAVDVFIDQVSPHWFFALRRYTDLIRQREEIVHPQHPAAWDPVWCTWTAFPSDQINISRVLENARIARDMGMGAIILDDGWFGPGLDDDGPRPINHGDYQPDPVKLPDLPALVKDVQAMGLKFLLWHAPLCVAPRSTAAAALKHLFMRDASGDYLSANGLHQLCPACPQVRAYVQHETQRLLRDYGIDGLKVDLFNCLSPQPCTSTDHEHDIRDPLHALDRLMGDQWAAAKQVKPDVLIELKQDYGNVRLARHGTMVRAGDTAYDIDTNLLRCAYTQAVADCVHVDPLVTSIHARPMAVAWMMIKALAGGVPTFSIDLPSLSPEIQQVIKAWLSYYNAHRNLFCKRRAPQGRSLNVWQGGSDKHPWLAVTGQACEVKLPACGSVTHLLNATDRDRFYVLIDKPMAVKLRCHNHLLNPTKELSLTLTPGCQLPALPGGLTEICCA